MASIEEVIARSRQPFSAGGGFSERKRFTVARSRAIQKVREFALADPHYYVLELIQSACANGAKYLDIRTEETRVVVSYVGGGFAESDLAQLFDFLFASKQDLQRTAIRSLAIGVNALL